MRALSCLAGSLVALTFTPALADDLPTRKAGLWEIKIIGKDAPSNVTMQQCTDATTDKDMATAAGQLQAKCDKPNIQKSGADYIIESACTMGPMRSQARSVFSGDFNSAYTVDVTSNVTGGPMPGKSTMKMEAKWLGPCKADQKPGDIIMPGMMKMNINDMKKMQNMLPK